jgi:hypothetical protein
MPVDSKTELVAQEDNLLRIVDASKAFQASTGAIADACRAKAPFVSFLEVGQVICLDESCLS